MHRAATYGKEGAMKLLKEWGGDPSAKDNVRDMIIRDRSHYIYDSSSK